MSLFDLRLETQRLILRPPRVEDFEGYAAMIADEEAARFIGGHAPRAGAWRRFLQQPGAWAVQGFGMFSVLDKSTEQWVGLAGPWRPEGWPGNEIGWSFRREAWGQGLATEAAKAAMRWAFEALAWDHVIHCIAPDNHPSKRVAERIGSNFLRQTQMPPPYETVVSEVWGQSREIWLNSFSE